MIPQPNGNNHVPKGIQLLGKDAKPNRLLLSMVTLGLAFSLVLGATLRHGFADANPVPTNRAAANLNLSDTCDPKYGGLHYFLGLVRGILGNFGKAIESLTCAIELNPKHSGAYFARGIVYIFQGKYEQAIADFIKSLYLTPNWNGPTRLGPGVRQARMASAVMRGLKYPAAGPRSA